jgi:hypothetical protein
VAVAVRVALRVVLVVLLPTSIGCARLAPELITSTDHQKAETRSRISGASIFVTPSPSTSDQVPPRVLETPREGEGEDQIDIDLYGNDVTDAVAKYKLDSYGALYELHSPQTQIPRLGSPKS